MELAIFEGQGVDFASLNEQANGLVVAAVNITSITTAEEYQTVVDLGRTLQFTANAITDAFKPAKQKLDAEKQKILDKERAAMVPVLEAKERLKEMIRAFDEQQRAIASREDDVPSPINPDTGLPEPSITQTMVPHVPGRVERTVWTAEIKNPLKLVQAIGRGEAPLLLIKWDQKRLNTLAGQLHETLNYPGVLIHESKEIHFRS